MDIPKYEIQELQKVINDKCSILNTIVDRYVGTYCSDLDSYMQSVSMLLEQKGSNLSDLDLEEITLKLPQYMYWASQGQEILNIKEEVSKALKNERFISFIDTLDSGSVGLKNKKAENEVLLESTVQYIYGYSSKIIKNKITYATEMLQSVKKIISKRMAMHEYENSIFSNGKKETTVIRNNNSYNRKRERDRF